MATKKETSTWRSASSPWAAFDVVPLVVPLRRPHAADRLAPRQFPRQLRTCTSSSIPAACRGPPVARPGPGRGLSDLRLRPLHRQGHRVPHRRLRPVPRHPGHEPAQKEGRGPRPRRPATRGLPLLLARRSPDQGRSAARTAPRRSNGIAGAHEAQDCRLVLLAALPPVHRPRARLGGVQVGLEKARTVCLECIGIG